MSPSQTPDPDSSALATSARSARPVIFLLIGLAILFVLGYSGRLLQIARLQQEIARWEQRIEDAEERQMQLEQDASEATSLDLVDDIAREELGLVKEGDVVVVVIEQTPVPTIASEPVDPESAARQETLQPTDSNWRQWLGLFKPADQQD